MHTEQAAAQGGEAFKISFIIPFYNVPLDMLQECIASVLRLSLMTEEREIILIDDGSTIDPQPLLNIHKESIKYMRQENQGLSAARNAGLDIATGTYIQFLDSDDYLLTDAYNVCIAYVRRNHDVDMLRFAFTSDEGKVHRKESFTKPVTGQHYMLNNNISAICCIHLFKRELLRDLRFHRRILHEDEEFTPQLILRAQSFVATNACAYYYRQRTDSIQNTENKTHITRRLNDMEKVISILQKKAMELPADKQQALLRRVHQLTMDYIYNTICLTGDRLTLEDSIQRLHNMELFPLPNKHYTWKYSLFRWLLYYQMGRKILLLMLSPSSAR